MHDDILRNACAAIFRSLENDRTLWIYQEEPSPQKSFPVWETSDGVRVRMVEVDGRRMFWIAGSTWAVEFFAIECNISSRSDERWEVINRNIAVPTALTGWRFLCGDEREFMKFAARMRLLFGFSTALL